MTNDQENQLKKQEKKEKLQKRAAIKSEPYENCQLVAPSGTQNNTQESNPQ